MDLDHVLRYEASLDRSFDRALMAARVNQIESLRAQLVALEKELGTDDNSKPIRKAADDLGEKLASIEGTLLQLKLTGRGQDDCRWSLLLLHKINYLFN